MEYPTPLAKEYQKSSNIWHVFLFFLLDTMIRIEIGFKPNTLPKNKIFKQISHLNEDQEIQILALAWEKI